MDVRTVAPMHGWLWVMHGFGLFRAYPAFWLLLLLFYWLLLVLVGALPLVGPWVATALIPGLSAGFMAACHAAQHKQPPLPAQLLAPLRNNVRPQLGLGIAYIAGLAVVMAVPALIDGGALFRALLRGERMSQEAMLASGILVSMPVAAALYAPVMLAFWFAPALCLWHGMAPAKALFFSFFAGLRNLRAFLVYGLAWLFFAGVIPFVAALLFALVMPKRPESAALVALILTPYMLIIACAMLCSFYSSYIAIFGAPQDGIVVKLPEPPV